MIDTHENWTTKVAWRRVWPLHHVATPCLRWISGHPALHTEMITCITWGRFHGSLFSASLTSLQASVTSSFSVKWRLLLDSPLAAEKNLASHVQIWSRLCSNPWICSLSWYVFYLFPSPFHVRKNEHLHCLLTPPKSMIFFFLWRRSYLVWSTAAVCMLTEWHAICKKIIINRLYC